MSMLRLLLPLLAIGCAACASSRPSCGETEALTELFDGSSLAGWVGGSTFDPGAISPEREAEWDAAVPAHWRVEDGELVSDGAGPHLVSVREFGDFELELDWKIQPLGDSGIYLRGYPQVQIWDPANPAEVANGAPRGSGGLWNNDVHERFPSALADRPPGSWNSMRIRMVGPVVDVWLNGVHVVTGVELDNYFHRGEPLRKTGPIHLQTHGSEVRFRNVRIRPLD